MNYVKELNLLAYQCFKPNLINHEDIKRVYVIAKYPTFLWIEENLAPHGKLHFPIEGAEIIPLTFADHFNVALMRKGKGYIHCFNLKISEDLFPLQTPVYPYRVGDLLFLSTPSLYAGLEYTKKFWFFKRRKRYILTSEGKLL